MKKWLSGILLFLINSSNGWGVTKINAHLSLTVTTDQSVYRSTEPIAMSLIVFNQGAQSEKITFPSSQTFDFILATGEQTVWKWSDGRLFAQSLRTITISPDKPLTYQTVYHPVTAKPILEEGLYQLVGVWTTMGKTYSSVPLTIEIRK